MIDIAKELIRLDEDIKSAKDALKDLEAQRDAVGGRLVAEMVDQEVQNLNVAGRILYLNNRTRYQAVAAAKDQLIVALESNGLADIVKPSINANTLSSTVAEMVEQNGGELPPWLSGLINTYSETKVGIRKGGN